MTVSLFRRIAFFLLPILSVGLLCQCASNDRRAKSEGEGNDAIQIDTSRESLYAKHFEAGRFFNPWQRFDPSLIDLFRAYFGPNNYADTPQTTIPKKENNGNSLSQFAAAPQLTWAGHSSVIIHDGHDIVLTDPHFTEKAFFFKRKSSPGVALAEIPAPLMAVISHNHYDHLDESTVLALPADMKWLVPKGLANWFRERGRTNTQELDWWESRKIDRWTVTCLPLQHWSSRIGFARDETLWCGWLIDSGKHRYLFVGDSGYFHGFAEFGRKFGPIDVAILPIGAYAPRWFLQYQHMDPQQALQATIDLNADYLFPVHWGTFQMTQEPVGEPMNELLRAADASNFDQTKIIQPAIGDIWVLPIENGR